MTDPQSQPTDGELLAAHLTEHLKPILGNALHCQSARALGVDVATSQRLNAAWERLIETGPGRLLVEAIVEAWELETAVERRRRSLWARLSALLDTADERRLETIEGMLLVLSAAPPILTAEMDDAVLAAHQEVALAAHQAEEVLRLPEEWCARTGVQIVDPDGWRGNGGRDWKEPITRGEFLDRATRCTTGRWPQPLLDEQQRKRVDCYTCGAEIRWDAREHAHAWIHVSTERAECSTGEGLASPYDPDEPF